MSATEESTVVVSISTVIDELGRYGGCSRCGRRATAGANLAFLGLGIPILLDEVLHSVDFHVVRGTIGQTVLFTICVGTFIGVLGAASICPTSGRVGVGDGLHQLVGEG